MCECESYKSFAAVHIYKLMMRSCLAVIASYHMTLFCVRLYPAKSQVRQTRQLDSIEQGLTSLQTQYRLSRRQFYRSKRPNQQYQSTV